MTPAIEVSGIQKTFFKKRSLGELIRHPFGRADRIHALRGVDMRVGEGEIFGLLGPNGAGKTTLLKILSCLVLPDEGQARVRGIDVEREHRVKPLIGLVHADERSFYWRLSARENLRFFARLYNLDGRRIAQRIQELLERVDMTEAADRPFSGYSSGMKQRVAIARALLHDPPILFMDEPTRSLDPAAAHALRSFVLEKLKHENGKTILLATHNLQEAEMMADRLAVLVTGRVRESGTVEQVRRWGLGDERFVIETDPGQDTIEGPFRIVDDESHDGRRRMTLTLEAGAAFEDMMRALMAAGIGLHSCDREQADLESAFARILDAEEDER